MKTHPKYYQLSCLTPVHIGSGMEYVKKIDFIEHGGSTWLLQAEQISERLSTLGQVPRAPAELEAALERLIRMEPPERYAMARWDGSIQSRNVRAAIRSGDGCPMIPGSSLKGALRTLLFVARASTEGPHGTIKPELDRFLQCDTAAPLERRIFRTSIRDANLAPHDAKRDLLRMLSVSDVLFPRDSTQPLMTAAAGTSRRISVAVEALKRGCRSVLQARFHFPGAERFFTELLPPWEKLAEWSRRHALHLLRTDRGYFSSANPPHPDCEQLLECFDELEKLIDTASSDQMFLRLGWGTGWCTMTGDVCSGERRKKYLPKSGEFGPKTRKVIEEGSKKIVDVLGWISLRPTSETEALSLMARLRPRVRPAPTVVPEARAGANVPTQSDEFLREVKTLQPRDWGRLDGLVQRAVADPARKGPRLAALGAKIAQVWDNRRRLQEAASKFPALEPYLRAPKRS
jgi:CRISPR-associated protein Csm5